MNPSIVDMRVEQNLEWSDELKQYVSTDWILAFRLDGDTEWKTIPVLLKHKGGPFDGLSFTPDNVAQKEI